MILIKLALMRPDKFHEFWHKNFSPNKLVGERKDGSPIYFKDMAANVRSLTFTVAMQDFRKEKKNKLPRKLPVWLKRLIAVLIWGCVMVDADYS